MNVEIINDDRVSGLEYSCVARSRILLEHCFTTGLQKRKGNVIFSEIFLHLFQ